MKQTLLSATCISIACILFADKYMQGQADNTGFAVVELFTSEGCSSCPPADKLLNKINEDFNGQPVYVLSFHVDYWDKFGWKDGFSKEQFTARQKMYDSTLRTDTYTPQVVVNGEKEAVGSDEKSLMQFIHSMLQVNVKAKALQCDLSVKKGKLLVAYQTDQAQVGDTINVALVQDNVSDRVTAGENNGQELKHVNVVREFKSERLRKTMGNLTLNIPDDLKAESLHVIAYTQTRGDLRVTSAFSTKIKYP